MEPPDPLLPAPVLHTPRADNAANNSNQAKRKKNARVSGGLRVHWATIKRRIGTGTAPSTSSVMADSSANGSYHRRPPPDEGLDEDVDEVVVDRAWSEDIKSSVAHSETGGSPEKSDGHHPPGTSVDHESIVQHGFWGIWTPLAILRWRVYPLLMEFFSSSFFDQDAEAHYRKENWFMRKSLALWSALFFVINWVLGVSFISHTPQLIDKIFLYGVAPALTLPIFFFVMYDWPRDRSNFYQVWVCLATWCWSFFNVLSLWLCGYYGSHSYFSCQGKDFLATFYYTSALQTIAIFGLKLNRLPALIGAVIFFGFSCGVVLPYHISWLRNLINTIVYQFFLLYTHYMRENAERRLYTLRDQLKVQFRATQKAQVNERKSADSKRRLTSYVFHEVRVPLNTALLAVQNMDASGTVAKGQEIEFNALEGSLSMMSKVLNDVLDFNRMDSGRFESVSKPYAFHQVMRSLFIPLRMATNARRLELVTELDPMIDRIARRSAYDTMGESPGAIRAHMKQHPEGDGMVLGDETRLRQIITNLASNACKFTPSGGKLHISTKLVAPDRDSAASLATDRTGSFSELSDEKVAGTTSTPSTSNQLHLLSATHLSQHNEDHSKPRTPLEWIVVRIEVTDTGCGIRSKDMAQSKLFSPFNQTELGRQQGGKGTGLGLALVRSIVKLSGGRLGVRSKRGEGSTFWVEIPLGVGPKAMAPPEPLELLMEATTPGELDVYGSADPTDATAMEAADASNVFMASQVVPTIQRSPAAMESLMEQGGRVELIVSKNDSNSPVLTRTIGDASTGTQVMSLPPDSPPTRPPLDLEPDSSETIRRPVVVQRPTFVQLPSPRSFTLDNGLQPSSSSASPPTAKPISRTGSSTPTPTFEPGLEVLVVDDDPLTRMLMKRLLSRLGCSVSTAENGEIALEMVLGPGNYCTPSTNSSAGRDGPILEQSTIPTESKYHIIFLDNQMPVLSGLKTVEKLRDFGRGDFVVGVTGNALLDDQNEYLEAGVDHVLTKPVLERNLKNMLILADERRKRAPAVTERITMTSMPSA
ncbi:hypothetical protein FIBSPDRAFT_920629 [Athelia psychrophila]|uniref:histidine kinase n=1 Tax=Athelia psychrophila TaxID=1759441 RepID=A0A166G8G8_9AGAM|nr:hypothetical protein FIBSPDRAFT_920629 [Fibularhizoctonia sp. CBS 109695]